ncbi:hypothetical protein AB0395_40910 [Streptosporangium sp. NPDC051023]|uniref:hypothetical protein n=1 Tax=Streptosporangium sp. NPDC051023 TaxID=3155410 RepID=UPI00345066F9
MGRADPEALTDARPVEVRHAWELRVGDWLAFEYGSATAPWASEMLPVLAESDEPTAPPLGWTWGLVTEMGDALRRTFPVVADRWTVWVLCEFGDQSSIITGIPHEVMIVTRRSAS